MAMLYTYPRSRDLYGQPVPGQFRRAQRAIDAAFERMRRDQSAQGFIQAYMELQRCPMGELSPLQNVDVKYVLGRSYIAMGRYDQGLDLLSLALKRAKMLQEHEAAIQITYDLGNTNRCVSRFSEAIRYHKRCVALLNDSPMRSSHEYLDLLVRTLAELAMFSDLCGLSGDAKDWLRQAELAARNLPPLHPQQGTIAWSYARFLRDEDRLDEALKSAERASDLYARIGSPAAYVRILTLTADIALDVADSLQPHSSERERHIELARLYAEQATSLAYQHGDLSGKSLALLTDAHLALTSRSQENRLASIIKAGDYARRHNDVALMIQIHTAMGAELEHQQSYDPARNMYVKALDLSRKISLPGLATAAIFGLRRVDGLLRRMGNGRAAYR